MQAVSILLALATVATGQVPMSPYGVVGPRRRVGPYGLAGAPLGARVVSAPFTAGTAFGTAMPITAPVAVATKPAAKEVEAPAAPDKDAKEVEAPAAPDKDKKKTTWKDVMKYQQLLYPLRESVDYHSAAFTHTANDLYEQIMPNQLWDDLDKPTNQISKFRNVDYTDAGLQLQRQKQFKLYNDPDASYQDLRKIDLKVDAAAARYKSAQFGFLSTLDGAPSTYKTLGNAFGYKRYAADADNAEDAYYFALADEDKSFHDIDRLYRKMQLKKTRENYGMLKFLGNKELSYATNYKYYDGTADMLAEDVWKAEEKYYEDPSYNNMLMLEIADMNQRYHSNTAKKEMGKLLGISMFSLLSDYKARKQDKVLQQLQLELDERKYYETLDKYYADGGDRNVYGPMMYGYGWP